MSFLSRLDDKWNLSEHARKVLEFNADVLTGGQASNALTKPTAAAILAPAPLPTLEDARSKVEASTVFALKKRKGRAASIMSARPDSALGYTGGGMLATRTLGGAA